MPLSIGSFKLMGIGLVCIACGAMFGELLDHTIHGRLKWFAYNQPLQIALTLPVTAAIFYFLWRQIQRARAEYAKPVQQREQAGATHFLIGVAFHTTPFIRATVYSAFYLLGILLNFLS